MVQDLYREVILAHYRSPANRHPLPDATAHGYAHNPLCGDELTVFARVGEQRLVDAAYEAQGCSIAHASADMMVDLVKGKDLREVKRLISLFEEMVEGGDSAPTDQLGALQVFREVRRFPVRVKCAVLPWTTLRASLDGAPDGTAGR